MNTVMTAQPVSVAKKLVASNEATATAFGLSAAVTVVFNVILAFVKDSYPPLNSFMAALTGHHWRTHGLVDVAVFLLLGWVFMARGIPGRDLAMSDVVTLSVATVIASGALGLWFILV